MAGEKPARCIIRTETFLVQLTNNRILNQLPPFRSSTFTKFITIKAHISAIQVKNGRKKPQLHEKRIVMNSPFISSMIELFPARH